MGYYYCQSTSNPVVSTYHRILAQILPWPRSPTCYTLLRIITTRVGQIRKGIWILLYRSFGSKVVTGLRRAPGSGSSANEAIILPRINIAAFFFLFHDIQRREEQAVASRQISSAGYWKLRYASSRRRSFL